VIQPFYPGDKAFSELLAQAQIPMDIHTVRAFLTGFILGPEYVPPQFAIEEILLVDTEREIKIRDMLLKENFQSAVLGLWNELAEMRPTAFRKVRPLPEAFDDFTYLIAYLNSLCEDASLFLGALNEAGLSLDDESWSEERVESAMEELEAFLAQAEHFLDSLNRKRTRTRADFSKLVRELCVLHDVWEGSYIEITSVLRNLRLAGKSPMLSTSLKPTISASKVAAPQATCSCGSGKTFRECCMLKLVN
jgi:hypothetical protein